MAASLETPQETRLIPNALPVFCHFNAFCRCGTAAYWLARGPSRAQWLPLGQRCAESLFGQAPDRLIRVAVEGAVQRGRIRFVQEPLQELLGAAADEATLRTEEQQERREFVLGYLAEHAGTDPEFVDKAVQALIGTTKQVAIDDLAELEAIGTMPGRVMMPPSDPATLAREAVLAYVKEHADDEDLLSAVAALFEGPGESEETDPPATPTEPGAAAASARQPRAAGKPKRKAVKKAGGVKKAQKT